MNEKKTDQCAICDKPEADPRHRVETFDHAFKTVRQLRAEAFSDCVLEFAFAVGSNKERVTAVVVSAELGTAIGAPLTMMTPFGLVRVASEDAPLARITDAQLEELAAAGIACVADGTDAMIDNVSSRGLGEMAEELLRLRRAGGRERPEPLGPFVRVDVYHCEADRLRVEVERAPGTDDAKVEAHMEAESGDPMCPACEREMTRVGSKLRKTVVR